MRHAMNTGRPAVFGEVVFDLFEDGSEVLGGAPFNVASHLAGFGHPALMVTAVGNDRRGREILERMRSRGLPTEAVAVDEGRPTGTAVVDLSDGEPRFELVSPVAYDAIPIEPALSEPAPSLLYFGTLAQRAEASRTTLTGLLETWQPEVFVDLNLRPPWSTPDVVQWSSEHATWLKLNRHELSELSPGRDGSGDLSEMVQRLFDRFSSLRGVMLTLGDDGARAMGRDGSLVVAPGEQVGDDELADTVGAGDAFSAVAMVGLLEGWPMEQTLERAVAFAATMCRHRGAVPDSQHVYAEALAKWR